jgi:Bacterial dnaA protein helix-turn-helix
LEGSDPAASSPPPDAVSLLSLYKRLYSCFLRAVKEQLHASKSPSRRRSRCVTGDTQVEIAASRGTQRIARALQIAIYLAHVGFGLSYTHLGEAFGRDRTTIRHACFRIEDARDDFSLDRALSILEGALRLHAQCIPSGEAQ